VVPIANQEIGVPGRLHGALCTYDGKINSKVKGAQVKLAATKSKPEPAVPSPAKTGELLRKQGLS